MGKLLTAKENNVNLTNYKNEKIDKIYNSLNYVEKDILYRKLWSDYVKKDVECLLDTEFFPEEENSISGKLMENIENIVLERYIYCGDYDCNLTYWDNLRNLISEVQKELD